ncbi:MAG: choice-of-anchor V domain-containing protein [Saprospiraceae bacterium]|nr:choice-of-anchor V domain-containing protein [Saprospiraceae bacterium]
MKRQLLFLFATLTFGYFLLTSSSGGRAASANEGNTGAPGDNSRTCVNCHNGGPISVDLDLEVLDLDDNVVTEYEPGENYRIRVTIRNTGNTNPSAHGFQMVALDAPLNVDGEDINNWVDTIANNYMIASARGRSYVEHDGPSTSNEFLVEWQAPTTSSGTISFYAAGNGVNRNGRNTGDGAAVDRLEIIEKSPTSSKDEISQIDIKLWPNPASDILNIEIPEADKISVELMDLRGTTIFQINEIVGKQVSIPVRELSLIEGLYIVRARNAEGGTTVRRVLISQ